MSSNPEILISGEIARLIPVIADSRKEQRVASVFLATISAVPSFSQALMSTLGQRLGQRSVIDTFTEVVLKVDKEAKDRPDGLLQVSTGTKNWSALIEAKIGNSDLEPEQVQRYLQLARDANLDAVITISNQFAARPDHSPVNVPKALTKRIPLYHWSWKFILTEAMLQQSQGLVTDPEQAFILREFVRFLSHESVGVSGFNQMPSEWRDLNTQLKSGGSLRRNSPEVESVVNAWHQETRDLALLMSRHLATGCELKLSRAHAKDADRRMKDDCGEVALKETLSAEFAIPNAASGISLDVDLKAQTIRVGMQIDAPQDRQRAASRVNWLLRQLKQVQGDKIFVRVIWPSRSHSLVCALDDLRNDADSYLQGYDQTPRAFEVFSVKDDGRRFAGRKTFIEDIEQEVPTFYDQIGQHLEQWRPKPPKPIKNDHPKDGEVEDQAEPEILNAPVTSEIITKPQVMPGNRHTDLLEIPEFLLRHRVP